MKTSKYVLHDDTDTITISFELNSEMTETSLAALIDAMLIETTKEKDDIIRSAYSKVSEMKEAHEREQEAKALAEKMGIADIPLWILDRVRDEAESSLIKAQQATQREQAMELYNKLAEDGLTDQQIVDAINEVSPGLPF
jgi:phosphoenolpyruvate synthase/pyruvate phosphate dikinase